MQRVLLAVPWLALGWLGKALMRVGFVSLNYLFRISLPLRVMRSR